MRLAFIGIPVSGTGRQRVLPRRAVTARQLRKYRILCIAFWEETYRWGSASGILMLIFRRLHMGIMRLLLRRLPLRRCALWRRRVWLLPASSMRQAIAAMDTWIDRKS